VRLLGYQCCRGMLLSTTTATRGRVSRLFGRSPIATSHPYENPINRDTRPQNQFSLYISRNFRDSCRKRLCVSGPQPFFLCPETFGFRDSPKRYPLDRPTLYKGKESTGKLPGLGLDWGIDGDGFCFWILGNRRQSRDTFPERIPKPESFGIYKGNGVF